MQYEIDQMKRKKAEIQQKIEAKGNFFQYNNQ